MYHWKWNYCLQFSRLVLLCWNSWCAAAVHRNHRNPCQGQPLDLVGYSLHSPFFFGLKVNTYQLYILMGCRVYVRYFHSCIQHSPIISNLLSSILIPTMVHPSQFQVIIILLSGDFLSFHIWERKRSLISLNFLNLCCGILSFLFSQSHRTLGTKPGTDCKASST